MIEQVVLAVIGLSAGIAIAAGLFSFLIGLGIVSVFADYTHTADKVLFYEDMIALGGTLGNLFFVFRIPIPHGGFLLPVFGIFAGVFVGCWYMALAEVLNVFPIFIRRIKGTRYIPWIVSGLAFGKGVGSLVYFYYRW